MTNEAPSIPSPKRRRRWHQFSLRTFLLFTTVVSGVAAYWLSTLRREETKLPGLVLREQLRRKHPAGDSDEVAPHGRFAVLDPFGRTRATGAFQRGQPIGNWRVYHQNGYTALSGKAVAGKRAGTWSIWNERGKRLVPAQGGSPSLAPLTYDPDIIRRLSSDDIYSIRGALRTLARLNSADERTVTEVRRLANSSDRETRVEALFALFALDPAGRDAAFDRLLAEPDVDDGPSYVALLGRLAELSRLESPRLKRALTSPDRDTRLRVLQILALMVELPRPPVPEWKITQPWFEPVVEMLRLATRDSDGLTAGVARTALALWERAIADDRAREASRGMMIM